MSNIGWEAANRPRLGERVLLGRLLPVRLQIVCAESRRIDLGTLPRIWSLLGEGTYLTPRPDRHRYLKPALSSADQREAAAARFSASKGI